MLLLLLVCLVVLVALLCGTRTAKRGGSSSGAPTHVVVDLLNLTHHLLAGAGALSTEEIVAAVDRSSACLHKEYPGRVMYVVKDRDSQVGPSAAHEAYRRAAARNQAYISLVEKYPDAQAAPAALASAAPAAAENKHSAAGRDDYYMAVLAARYRCPVMTGDRLKDFDEFRGSVAPFHVTEYAYWRAYPARDYVNPASQRLRRPRTVSICVDN